MMTFELEFYQKLFQALDGNSVIMKVEKDGSYIPIWCSEEFLEMIEGTEEEYIQMENGGGINSIHPEDRDQVEYLFRNQRTREGTNHLDVRKQTVKGSWKWVKVRYAFLESGGDTVCILCL